MPRRLPDDRFKKKRLTPTPNTIRLFLGIYPPDNYISYFRDVYRSFEKQKRNVNFTPVDQIHLTVKFIGSEVTFGSKDIIFEELTKLSGNLPKPEIILKNIQFGFSYQQDPQHIICTIEETPELKQLYAVIHDRLRNLGLMDTIRWKGKNSDNFHITLGRMKPKKSRSIGRALDELAKAAVSVQKPEPFLAEYMELVESKVTTSGPVYRKIGRIKL